MDTIARNQGRIRYIDLARAIAIISITFNHAVNRSFAIYQGTAAEMHAFPFWLSALKTALYIFSRVGVPIFLMITGALLLPRDYEGGKWKRFMKHNWLQLLITTEIWLVIMYWYLQLAPNSILHTRGIVQCLIHFVCTLLFIEPVSMASMWYMYMILCVYLLIPLFSVGIKRLSPIYYAVPICLAVVSKFVMTDFNMLYGGLKGAYTSVSMELSASSLFSFYAVYLFAGYFISKGLLSRVKSGVILIGSMAAFLVLCGFQYWLFGRSIDQIASYSSFLLLVWAVLLFELLRRAKIKDGLMAKGTAKLAEISFGIYFVHICIMEGLEVLMNRYWSSVKYLPRFLILESVSFFGAIVIIQVLRRIPWCAKYLFGIKPVKAYSEA